MKSLLAALALSLMAGAASAEGPVKLTDAEMDSVREGVGPRVRFLETNLGG